MQSAKCKVQSARAIIGIALTILLLVGTSGCLGTAKRGETTSELGAAARSQRISAGYGPSWRLTMPVVQRNRKPKASTWPAALESFANAAPEALAALAPSGNVLAALGLADSLGRWLVPDLSNTQNIVLEADGLATSIIAKNLKQTENADGSITTSIESIEVTAGDTITILPGPTPATTPGPAP